MFPNVSGTKIYQSFLLYTLSVCTGVTCSRPWVWPRHPCHLPGKVALADAVTAGPSGGAGEKGPRAGPASRIFRPEASAVCVSAFGLAHVSVLLPSSVPSSDDSSDAFHIADFVVPNHFCLLLSNNKTLFISSLFIYSERGRKST